MYGDQLPRVGALLRGWRQRRRLSQLELALLAGSSARHLSCVETGRASPSREMVLRLAEHLDVPLRERNGLLLSAGYAPEYRESPLDAAHLGAARDAIQLLLDGHEPYPAVVVDRLWNVVAGNRAMSVLMDGVPPDLLEGPPNVLRLALHPDGLAARSVDFAQLRATMLGRLWRQVEATGDERLRALYEEVAAYEQPAPGDSGTEPGPLGPGSGPGPGDVGGIVATLRFTTPHDGVLSMFSTVATFGAPADVTLSELAIELFFPADEHTGQVLRKRAEGV